MDVWSREHTYILILNDFDDVPFAVKHWRLLKSWNTRAFVFVILNFASDRIVLPKDIKTIFELFLIPRMMNVYIVYQNLTTVNIANWLPYAGDNCANRVDAVYHLDQCIADAKQESGVSTIEHLEVENPIKIPQNLHKCTLKVSASVWEPFANYLNGTNRYGTVGWRGIEVNILTIFAQKMNMTIDFIRNYERRSNRVVSNRTGVYAPLLNGFVSKFWFSYMNYLAKQRHTSVRFVSARRES